MVKAVSFKEVKEKNIIEYLEDHKYLDNFSYYVKNLIKEDMNRVESNQKESTESTKRKSKFVIG